MDRIQASVFLAVAVGLWTTGARAGDILIDEDRQSGTRQCGGASAVVDSNSNDLSFRDCSGVTINGNRNTIDAGSPAWLKVLGNDNRVTWQPAADGRRPRVTNLGSRNVLAAAAGATPARADEGATAGAGAGFGAADTDRILAELGAVQKEDRIQLSLGGDILFDFDSTAIRPESAEQLAKAAHVIRQKSVGEVYVVGHSDSKGGTEHNQKLSQARAAAVIAWLNRNEAIPAESMVGLGMGSKKPIAHNTLPDGSDNPDGRARNRRVEIALATRPGVDLRTAVTSVRIDEGGIDVGGGAVRVEPGGVRVGGVEVKGAQAVSGDFTCSAGQACKVDCPTGGCKLTCSAGATCDFSCTGGSCTMLCSAGGTCDFGCAGGKCRHTCALGSQCRTRCEGGGCSGS